MSTDSRRAPSVGRGLLRWVVAPALVLVAGLVVLGLVVQLSLAERLGRIDGAFDGLASRPAVPAPRDGGGALNVLVAVTDSASRPPCWRDAAAGVGPLMLLHLDADRQAAYLALLSPQWLVDVPGKGMRRLDSALDGERPALVVAAVESLTGLRLDHLVLTTWPGLRQLGQEVDVIDPEAATDGFRDGPQRLQHQVEYLRLLTDETLHTRMRKRPFEVYRVLNVLTRSTAVDAGWSSGEMRDLAISVRNLRSHNIVFLAPPTTGPDAAVSGAGGLWRAMARDETASWLTAHPEAVLPSDAG